MDKIIKNIDKGIKTGIEKAEAKSGLNDWLSTAEITAVNEFLKNQWPKGGTKAFTRGDIEDAFKAGMKYAYSLARLGA